MPRIAKIVGWAPFSTLVIVATLILLLASSGCSPDSESEVIGTYQLIHSNGKDTIRLVADHTYRKTVISEEGKQHEEIGNWRLEKAVTGKQISLAAQASDAVVYLPIQRWFSVLYLANGEKVYEKIE